MQRCDICELECPNDNSRCARCAFRFMGIPAEAAKIQAMQSRLIDMLEDHGVLNVFKVKPIPDRYNHADVKCLACLNTVTMDKFSHFTTDQTYFYGQCECNFIYWGRGEKS